MPSEIIVDIREMDVGDSIHVRDLKMDPSIKILTPSDTTVLSIAVLRKAEEVAEVAEEVAEEGVTEPEVIKKEKAEEIKEAK